MTPKLLQLYALLSQVQSIIATEEAELGMVMPSPQNGCPHPEDKRIDTTTFGTEPSFKCQVCGERVKGVA